MTRYLRWFVALALLSASCLAQLAQLPVTKLETLASEIQKEDDALAGPTSSLERSSVQSAVAILRAALAQKDFMQSESTLLQLSAVAHSEPLRARCREAATEVRNLREANAKQITAQIDAGLKHAGDAIRSARKAADLDAVLQELGQLKRSTYDQQTMLRTGNPTQLDSAVRFVSQWQTYLAQRAAGDTKAALSALESLLNETQVNLVPRSEILALRYGAAPAVTPAASARPAAGTPSELKIASLDDLAGASEKLGQWLQNANQLPAADRGTLQQRQRAITALAAAYQEFRQGLPTKLEVVTNDEYRYGDLGGAIAPLRAQLIKLVLPRYLGLSDSVKARADETPSQFLQRVGDEAVSKGDFLLAARCRATQQFLREGKTTPSLEYSQAGLFVMAENQQTAGEFTLAVANYERALARGEDLVPAKVIGERLARIKAEHPREYEAGLNEFLTPRLPPLPPGFDYTHFGLPPGIGRPPPTPPAALNIPAATKAPLSPTPANPPATASPR